MYHIAGISPAWGGFGEYAADGQSPDELYESVLDALAEISHVGEVWELGKDVLPGDTPDIRGLIHGEPDRVYAWYDDDGQTRYFGIVRHNAA